MYGKGEGAVCKLQISTFNPNYRKTITESSKFKLCINKSLVNLSLKFLANPFIDFGDKSF